MERRGAWSLLFALVVLAVVHHARGWTPPDFCHGYACPEFDLVMTYQDFEERAYLPSLWITTSVPSSSSIDLQAGFMRLKDYCNGKNQQGAQVTTKTWPALISVTLGGDGSQNVSVSWFVPPGTALPQPTDPSIMEELQPAAIVYVRVFGGLVNPGLAASNKQQLIAALTQAAKPFQQDRYTGAGYDSPWDILVQHHNEIWMYAT